MALARLRARRRPPSTDPLRGPSSDGAPGAVPTESLRRSGPGRDLGSVRSVQHPGQRPGRSPSSTPPRRVGSASPRLAAGRRPGPEAPSRTGAARPSACLQRPPRAAAPVHGRLGVRPEGPRGRVTSGCGRPPWGPVRVALVTGRPIAQRAALAWPSGRPPRRTSAVHDPEQLSQGTSGARGAASGRHRGGGRGSGPSWAGRGGFAEACVQAHRSRRRPGPARPRLGLLTPAAAAGAAAGSARLPPSCLPLLCSSWVAFVCTLRCDKSLLSSPVYLS